MIVLTIVVVAHIMGNAIIAGATHRVLTMDTRNLREPTVRNLTESPGIGKEREPMTLGYKSVQESLG